MQSDLYKVRTDLDDFTRGVKFEDFPQMMLQLNGKPIDALAMVVHKSNVQKVGRIWTKKLSK